LPSRKWRITLGRRHRKGAIVRIYSIVLGAALLLLAAQPVAAHPPGDDQPPTFAGLVSATTCVPGPAGGQSASYTLRWEPASDNVTPPRKIVYDIFQASSPGAEDFSVPTYTTRHGATSFVTPPLPADEPVYFVVRARDKAGNRDANKVERQGQNLCV
jgi:hypothetical protein